MYKIKQIELAAKEPIEKLTTQPNYRQLGMPTNSAQEPYFALKPIDTKKREVQVE